MIQNHLMLLLDSNHTVKRFGQTSIICKEICTTPWDMGDIEVIGCNKEKGLQKQAIKVGVKKLTRHPF